MDQEKSEEEEYKKVRRSPTLSPSSEILDPRDDPEYTDAQFEAEDEENDEMEKQAQDAGYYYFVDNEAKEVPSDRENSDDSEDNSDDSEDNSDDSEDNSDDSLEL